MLLPDDPARAFMPYPAAAVPNGSGPLDGLTLAVKDLFDVTGYPTSGGSPHLLALSGVKPATAPAVQGLLDAGARFVGKTITDELAFSLNGRNAHFGTPLNGAAPDRIPGGSSSGSASAVSNGLSDLALGSDTGGSVRAPASHNGLFGIRPTHGRAGLEGAVALARSFDTPGVFAREPEAFSRASAALLGEDPAPLPEAPRLMIAGDAFALIDGEVRAVLAPVVKRIEEVLGQAAVVDAAPGGFDELYWAFRRLQAREAWQEHGAMIERYRLPLGPGVAERFAYGRGVTDTEVADSSAVRARFRDAIAGLLGRDAVLLLPTMPDVAPLLAEDEASLDEYRNRALRLLCLAGLSGLPQVTMPLASRLGAPLGISVIGPAGSDVSLARLAARLAA